MINAPVTIARLFCAHRDSEQFNVAEKANLVAGDYPRALYWRARSVVAWDRALRQFDKADNRVFDLAFDEAYSALLAGGGEDGNAD